MRRWRGTVDVGTEFGAAIGSPPTEQGIGLTDRSTPRSLPAQAARWSRTPMPKCRRPVLEATALCNVTLA